MNYVPRLQQGTRQKQKKFCSLFASGERKTGKASDNIKGTHMCCAVKNFSEVRATNDRFIKKNIEKIAIETQ